ncbi:MAG: coenzyme F420-0:L-glutamate ligase [Candidatus Bathyarchaeota archaeon]|nr:MAG: coenzyme F420-0:L-glutamate ligase [Candidatus Bathyarchaeota archaeon]
MAGKYKALAVKTRYWKPNDDYIKDIIEAIKHVVADGDFVTVSEKAISTALGNIVDESKIKPSRLARFIAKYWMRIAWPYVLGPVCHLRKKTIDDLRCYPVEEGSRHKQLALQRSGFFHALMHGSEGGIDGSNLPFSYVCLPLENAEKIVYELRERIHNELGKKVSVAVVDTDKTYSLNGFHFTPRPKPIKGIFSFGGFVAYVVGWSLKLKKRATPLALSGSRLSTDDAIEIAKIANRTRGAGAGRTVWDMAKNFKVSLTGVTWEMLEQTEHRPVVIIRFKEIKSKTHKNEC